MGIVLAAAPIAAKEHIVAIAWSADGAYRHAAPVAPGRFVEVCGRLPVGRQVAWSFDSTAPMDFNIHYHVGKDAVFPTRLTQAAVGHGTLAVTVEADYCWMWTNKGPAVERVSVTLQR